MAGQEAAQQEQKPPKREYHLDHNDFFRARADPKLVQAVVTSVRGSMEKGVKVSSYDEIPVIRKGYMGSDMSGLTREDWKAFHSGSPIVVLQVTEKSARGAPAIRHVAIGSCERLGLGSSAVSAAGEGGFKSLPLVDAKISSMAEDARKRGNTIEVNAIYITRPLDCLQFVNNTVQATGARGVRPQSGRDLYDALSAEGKAILETVDVITGDPAARSSFFNAQKQGDVVLFLRRLDITAGESNIVEQTSGGDPVIWIGKDGKVIPRSIIEEIARKDPESVPGISYQVRHSAIFGGIDKKSGRPLLVQSHILSGNLSVEPFDQYIQSHGVNYGVFDAVGVISLEFFAPSSKLVTAK